jgi:multicomponent Na+:H+ antiporter subunit G
VASAFASAIPYVADALVILGVFVMTVGVYGAIRMPDTYTKLHAMSKAVFLGVVSLCASSAVTGDSAIIYRAILIGVFLLVTTPISSFVIARRVPARGEDGDTGRVRRVRTRAHEGKGVSGPVSPDGRFSPAGIEFTVPLRGFRRPSRRPQGARRPRARSHAVSGHPVTFFEPLCQQCVRDPVRSGVEFGVAPTPLTEDEGDLLRAAERLTASPMVLRHARTICCVPI